MYEQIKYSEIYTYIYIYSALARYPKPCVQYGTLRRALFPANARYGTNTRTECVYSKSDCGKFTCTAHYILCIGKALTSQNQTNWRPWTRFGTTTHGTQENSDYPFGGSPVFKFSHLGTYLASALYIYTYMCKII